MNIRKSTPEDIDIILRMYDHSRSVMRADGNLTQWVGYPTREDIEEDIARGVSYLVLSEQCLVLSNPVQDGGSPLYTIHSPLCTPIGTFALVPGEEPTYSYIDHGRWIDETTPYSTLHRLAAMPNTKGIADIAFRYAKEHYAHLRVDTHHDNRPMRHILEKQGFVYCGIIYMPDGAPRDAYEWWRYDEVPADLRKYVETAILPRHKQYDAAHRPDHIRRVIARAMNISRPAGKIHKSNQTTDFWISPKAGEMIYATAAMHDIGICEGRKVHHLASGRIIRADKNLRRWFTEEEIEIIAQAAEDHRASATTKPRSLLGCIISEADRDIEPETIVCRTVEYGLSHYPELDREGHWQRTLNHLHEKYAEGGYIKLWMDKSPNAAPLAELRSLIKNEKKLRILFENLFQSLKH